MAEQRWFHLRLWVISAALFLTVFAMRIYVDAQGNAADVYPIVAAFQWYGYGAALFLLAVWIGALAETGHSRRVGCFVWVIMAFASLVAIALSIPK